MRSISISISNLFSFRHHAIGLALVVSMSSISFAQSSVVAGKVTSADGAPISGAHVRIVQLGIHVDAAPDGTFTFQRVPAGSYLIESKSPRFSTRIVRLIVMASEPPTLDIVMSVAGHEEAIVVSAGIDASSLAETARPITVLAGVDLEARLKSTLGETLAEQPGVSSTSFGPGASRPVIRGMGGDRVRILQGGVGTADASNTSPDHAVSFDPLSAQQIEIVRGPATLLYGSTAIGGVVNVIDGRIPEARSESTIGGLVDIAGGSGSDEKQGGASLHGGQGRFAWHLDGLRRKTDDVKVPIGDGRLSNSATLNTAASIGASVIGDGAFFGANVSAFDTTYGIPSEENVTIDLRQRRLDLKGGVSKPFAAFRGLKFRLGVADYDHSELEGAEVGTRFESRGSEGRLEFLHKDVGAFKGAFGFQAQGRDLTVTGEEAFLPPTNTDSVAGFFLEEVIRGRARFAVGGRAEHQRVNVVAGDARSMTGVSGSAGVTFEASHGVSFDLALARSERLPGAEELFSDGPHAATNAFEVGDPGLTKERSLGLDASIKKSGGRITGQVSLFRNDFSGYIFERFTDEEEDGLRVVRYEQRDTLFTGLEAQVSVDLLEQSNRHLALEGSTDYIRARVESTDEPLPRIAPRRFGVGLHYRDSRITARAEARISSSQDKVSAFETETAGFTLVNATFAYRVFAGRTIADLVIRGTNLADVEGRNHVSYLKDLVPLPGRDIRASIRFQF